MVPYKYCQIVARISVLIEVSCPSFKSNQFGFTWQQLELLIAKKDFGISFRGCVSFSTAAQDTATFLDMQIWFLKDLSIIGRAFFYSSWLADVGLRDIAMDLATIDGTQGKKVYEALRRDIIKGRYMIPSIII